MSQKHKQNKAQRRKERVRLDKAAGRVQNQLANLDKSKAGPVMTMPGKPKLVKELSRDKPDESQIYKVENFVRRHDIPWPTISACLMVRDEEENMIRVLDSVVDVVDEIIIIDTGSKDRTMDIIREHRAWPMVKLSEEPWRDDFSAMRNHTVEKATSDWVLYIDADEELFFEDGFDSEALRVVFQNLPSNCSAMLIDFHDIRDDIKIAQHWLHRFFRAGSFHFRGIIHNAVIMDNPDDKLVNCGGVYLKHYGYADSAVRRDKLDRTERLLLKQLDIPDENLHTHFYLAEMYGMKDDAEKVVEHAQIYLAMQDDPKILGSDLVARGFFGAIYYPLAKRLMALGRYKEVPKIILKGLLEYPHDLDLLRALSDLGVETNNPETIAMGSRNFCQAYASGQWRAEKAHPLFNASQEAFALQLYRLIIVRLDQLTKNFRALKPVLDDLTDEIKDNFLEDIGTNFTKSGLLSSLNILPIDLAELIKPPVNIPETEANWEQVKGFTAEEAIEIVNERCRGCGGDFNDCDCGEEEELEIASAPKDDFMANAVQYAMASAEK